MKKLILSTILPGLVIFIIASFFAVQQYLITVSSDQTIVQAKFELLKEYWYLVLFAFLALIYIRFIAPKIFKD
jgi:hypothetical protein